MKTSEPGVPTKVYVRSLRRTETLIFFVTPREVTTPIDRACNVCALKHGEDSCMDRICAGGTFLTEERYLRAKLLGIQTLEPL